MFICGAAAVLAMASGCSSSGGEAKTPTKAAYIKAADKICKKGDAATSKAADKRHLDDAKGNAPIVAYIKEDYLPNVRQQISDIRDLGYPKGDQTKLEKIYDDAEALFDKVEADPEKYVNASDPFKSVNDRLKAYGFKSCGSD
jgi:hypothetical protein